MDHERFDEIAKALAGAGSRRRLLRGLAGATLGAGLARLGGTGVAAQDGESLEAADADAATQAAGRRRCLRETKECKRDDQCCSGVCRKKKCRPAPNQGTCTIERDVCRTGDERCGRNGGALCHCRLTTAGASFCGGGGTSCAGEGFPAICDRDADCDEVTGNGSACVRTCAGSGCAGSRGCLAPCSSPR